jgi:hypothetical protein
LLAVNVNICAVVVSYKEKLAFWITVVPRIGHYFNKFLAVEEELIEARESKLLPRNANSLFLQKVCELEFIE